MSPHELRWCPSREDVDAGPGTCVPKAPLSTSEVVDTLDRLDLLELPGRSPWREAGPDDDAFPVDWDLAEAPIDGRALTPGIDEDGRGWEQIAERLRQKVRPRGGPPPPVDPDALAWYQPLHYFASSWGIYIREAAVMDLAAYILEAVPSDRRFERDAIFGAVRMGLGVLYLHEAFHHRVESFAIGLEIAEHVKRYCPYHDAVYKPLARAHSEDLLEESLATAESYRRLSEDVYRRSVPTDMRKVARQQLQTWIRSLPPGYNLAPAYFAGAPFDSALHELCSQVQETVTVPVRPHHEWRLASALHRQLFNCKTTTWVVVPLGQRPLVPWFDRDAPAAVSVSTRRFIKLLSARFGYQQVNGAKHLKLVKTGMPTLILPANRDSLSPVVLSTMAHALGFRSARAMWDSLTLA